MLQGESKFEPGAPKPMAIVLMVLHRGGRAEDIIFESVEDANIYTDNVSRRIAQGDPTCDVLSVTPRYLLHSAN